MLAEEDFLSDKFGDDFEKWSKEIPSFFPKFSKWDGPVLKFSLKNILRREYSSFFALILCFTMLDLIGNFLVTGIIFIVPLWMNLLWISFATYLIFRTLKRYTKILDVEGR